MLKKVLVTTMIAGMAVAATALPAAADTTISVPLPTTGCALNTHLSSDVDPQDRPPVDITGTNVGIDCTD